MWKLSRNNSNKTALYHAGAVPPLIGMLQSNDSAERAPAMAALWNLSLRSSRCEQIRAQMIEKDILSALADITQTQTDAMGRIVRKQGSVSRGIDDNTTIGLAKKLHEYLDDLKTANDN